MCTQVRVHTHTNTHIHSLPADSCALFKTSQRNKSPATPDPEERLRRKVSTAWPGGGRQHSGTGPAGAQAEGRPEALQSSGLLPGLGCSPVGAWDSLPESQTSQHRKRVPRFIGEMEGEQEARELGDMGRCTLLPGRGQRPRQRKGGVPPQAASPSGATRGAEQSRG